MPTSDSRRSLPARVWLCPGRRLVRARLARCRPRFRTGQPASSSRRPEQAQELLQNQPELVDQLRAAAVAVGADARSGARAAPGRRATPRTCWTTTSRAPTRPQPRSSARGRSTPSARSVSCPATEADSLRLVDSLGADVGLAAARARLARACSAPTRSAPTRWPIRSRCSAAAGLKLFGARDLPPSHDPVPAGAGRPGGRELPARPGRRAGPHPHRRRRARRTRSRSPAKGFIVIPQVGQVYVANLTLGQLEDQLYARLGRVYSGRAARRQRRAPGSSSRSPGCATFRSTSPATWCGPGAYQISSAGTVLTALYAAGGPTDNGSFRRVEIRRGGTLVDSLDLYDYLLRGMQSAPTSGSRPATWCSSRCTAASPRWPARCCGRRSTSCCPSETLRDVIAFAGGLRSRPRCRPGCTIHRILPPASRGPGGRARVVIAVGADQFSGGVAPAVPMAPGRLGDGATPVADRQRGFVTVRGNVWVEGQVGLHAGHEAERRDPARRRPEAGRVPGPHSGHPDARGLEPASSSASAFADSTGRRAATTWRCEDQDEIRIFSRTTFRPERVRRRSSARCAGPGRVPYREGMTMRDAHPPGRRPDGGRPARGGDRAAAREPAARGRWPRRCACRSTRATSSGAGAAAAAGARRRPGATTPLQPYDNVLVLRQGEWSLQRTVVADRTGQVPGPLLAPLQDRAADRPDRARRRAHRPRPTPGGIQFYRAYVGNTPTGTDRLRSLAPADAASRDTHAPAALPERVGIDLPRVLKDPKFRDNIILVERRLDPHPGVQSDRDGPGRGELTGSRWPTRRGRTSTGTWMRPGATRRRATTRHPT